MKARELLRLPCGNFKATNGNYKYDLLKCLCEDGSYIYRFTIEGSYYSNSVCFFEKEDFYFSSEYRWEYGNYKHTVLTGMAGIDGMNLHSEDVYNCLSSIYLLPRGSFKIYAQSEVFDSPEFLSPVAGSVIPD